MFSEHDKAMAAFTSARYARLNAIKAASQASSDTYRSEKVAAILNAHAERREEEARWYADMARMTTQMVNAGY